MIIFLDNLQQIITIIIQIGTLLGGSGLLYQGYLFLSHHVTAKRMNTINGFIRTAVIGVGNLNPTDKDFQFVANLVSSRYPKEDPQEMSLSIKSIWNQVKLESMQIPLDKIPSTQNIIPAFTTDPSILAIKNAVESANSLIPVPPQPSEPVSVAATAPKA